jgi:hypothetical protein
MMVLGLLIALLLVVLAAGIFISFWLKNSKVKQEEPEVDAEESLPKFKLDE